MSIDLIYHGHSCFTVSCQDYSIVLDPYDDHVPGYRPLHLEANEVLCSHEHGDHAFREAVELTAGGTCPFQITAYEVPHDDCGGKKRGMNRITVLEAEGLKVIHFGDIGCDLPEDLAEKLSGADAVMIPVGGFFTIDAGQAVRLYRRIGAKVMIPMHYRLGSSGFDVIGTLDDFEKQAGSLTRAEGSALSVTADLQPGIIALRASEQAG